MSNIKTNYFFFINLVLVYVEKAPKYKLQCFKALKFFLPNLDANALILGSCKVHILYCCFIACLNNVENLERNKGRTREESKTKEMEIKYGEKEQQ